VGELLDNLTDTIQDLQPHQIHSFYESVGLMISAEGEKGMRGGGRRSVCGESGGE
jgi:exportin-1